MFGLKVVTGRLPSMTFELAPGNTSGTENVIQLQRNLQKELACGYIRGITDVYIDKDDHLPSGVVRLFAFSSETEFRMPTTPLGSRVPLGNYVALTAVRYQYFSIPLVAVSTKLSFYGSALHASFQVLSRARIGLLVLQGNLLFGGPLTPSVPAFTAVWCSGK